MKSVARKMGLSGETVKQYVCRVREKYARAARTAPTKFGAVLSSRRGRASPPSPRIPPLAVAGITGDTRPRPTVMARQSYVLPTGRVMTPLGGHSCGVLL